MSNSDAATQLIPEENHCSEDISKCLQPTLIVPTLIVEDVNIFESPLKSPELDGESIPDKQPEPDEELGETQPEDTSKHPDTGEIVDENFGETQAEDIFRGPGPATLLLEDEVLRKRKPEETFQNLEPYQTMQEETSKDPITQVVSDENLMPEETSKEPESATLLLSDEKPSQNIPEDIFKCSFCKEHYDLDIRVQKVLDPCGHYLCLKCLKDMFFSGPLEGRQCPACNSPFASAILNPEDFPTNLSVSQILENRAKTSLGDCPDHACPRKLFCITDQVPVCKYCPEYGEHKGHQVQLIKVLRDKTELKRERLNELLLDNVEKKQKREQEIEDSAVKMQEFLIDQFLEMDSLLQLKEEEISEQIKTVLKIESDLVINACNENQAMLENKIAGITQEISQNEYGFLTRDASEDENFDPLLEENNDLEAETELILDRFLKTIESLKPVPKHSEAFTQTNGEISENLLQNEHRIPKLKTQLRKAFKSATKEIQEPEPEPEPEPKPEPELEPEPEPEPAPASMKAEDQLSPSKKLAFSSFQEKNDAMEEEFEPSGDQLHVTNIQNFNTRRIIETESQHLPDETLMKRIVSGRTIEQIRTQRTMETESQNRNDETSIKRIVSGRTIEQVRTQRTMETESHETLMSRIVTKRTIEEVKNQLTTKTVPGLFSNEAFKKTMKAETRIEEIETQAPMETEPLLPADEPLKKPPQTAMEIEDLKTQMTVETGPKLNLDVSNKILSDEIFDDLCSEQLWNQSFKKKIHCLEIDFSTSSLTDQQFIKFVKTILADLKNLSSLNINLAETKISNESIQVLSQQALKNYQLKSLKLNGSKTTIDDEGIHSLDDALNLSIETLETLEIVLDSTEIEGEKFLESLSKMNQLRNLRLSFDNSQVSAQIVTSIVACLYSLVKNLESLDLNFNGTEIEDKSLEGFSHHAVSKMDKLKHFKLALGDTFITEDFLENLFQSLNPLVIRLVTLELDLHFTELKNAAFKLFCEVTLRCMVNLETLKLDFSQTKINDVSLRYMLLLFSKLKCLTLNFNETKLTDPSIIALKENNSFGCLESLTLSFEQTQISDYTLQEFFNHIKKQCERCKDLHLSPTLEGVFAKPDPKTSQPASQIISKYSSSSANNENHPPNDDNKNPKGSKKVFILDEAIKKEMLSALKKIIIAELDIKTPPRNITSAKILDLIQSLDLERYNRIVRRILTQYLPISEAIPQDLAQWRKKIKTWIQSTVKIDIPKKDCEKVPHDWRQTPLEISQAASLLNKDTLKISQKVNKEAASQRASEKVFSKCWLEEYGKNILFTEKIAEVLRGMSTRSFPVLYEGVLKTMQFMKELFIEYKDWELPVQTTSYWWYGVMGKEKVLGDLWRKLPLPENE